MYAYHYHYQWVNQDDYGNEPSPPLYLQTSEKDR